MKGVKIGRTHFNGFGEKKLNPSVGGRSKIIYSGGKKIVEECHLYLSSGECIVHRPLTPKDTRIGLTIFVKSSRTERRGPVQNDNEILGLRSKDH